MPYGSQPIINKSNIQLQDACFIYPSKDQPQEMKRQAALIVNYPDPIQIQGTLYHFFILWANIDYINKIGSTLNFI
jgi:TolB protein